MKVIEFEELMNYVDCATTNQKWFIMQWLENYHGVKVQTANDKREEE